MFDSHNYYTKEIDMGGTYDEQNDVGGSGGLKGNNFVGFCCCSRVGHEKKAVMATRFLQLTFVKRDKINFKS